MMTNSKNPFLSLSLADMCNQLMLSEDERTDELIEEALMISVSNENVNQLKVLFDSRDRFANVVGLRVLLETDKADAALAYEFVDQLFDRSDTALERLTVLLILDCDIFLQLANSRMAARVDSQDVVVRKNIRRWFLHLKVGHLRSFFYDFGPFEDSSNQLLATIIDFKERGRSINCFLDSVKNLDDVAYEEYSRLSKIKTKSTRSLFFK